MESTYSVVTQLPPVFRLEYEPFLFHKSEHLQLQSANWITYYLLEKTGKKAMAQVSFFLDKDQALTPVKAPFGSYVFSSEITPKSLFDFVKEVEKRLKKLGAHHVTMIEPPFRYRRSDLLQSILFNLDYRVGRAEISAIIPVDAKVFQEKIASGERGKLKQAVKKGVTYRWMPLTELQTVYSFILSCKEERGYPSGMTFDQLEKTVNQFKKEFLLLGAFLDKEMVAAAIAIRVNGHVLYNFNVAHPKKFNSLSPVLVVFEELYRYCVNHHIEWLDLGTSAKDGLPNFSLLDFKLRLGAVPSMKLTFEKDLA